MCPINGWAFVWVCLLSAGCSSSIKRSGYSVPRDAAPHVDSQHIPVMKNMVYEAADAALLGIISARDTGFAVKCSEAYVLGIFRNDAGVIGADVVNIIQEKQPSIWVTCYRATAQLLRFNDRAKAQALMSDAEYSDELVKERSKKGDRIMRNAVIGGALGGAIGGAAAGAMTK